MDEKIINKKQFDFLKNTEINPAVLQNSGKFQDLILRQLEKTFGAEIGEYEKNIFNSIENSAKKLRENGKINFFKRKKIDKKTIKIGETFVTTDEYFEINFGKNFSRNILIFENKIFDFETKKEIETNCDENSKNYFPFLIEQFYRNDVQILFVEKKITAKNLEEEYGKKFEQLKNKSHFSNFNFKETTPRTFKIDDSSVILISGYFGDFDDGYFFYNDEIYQILQNGTFEIKKAEKIINSQFKIENDKIIFFKTPSKIKNDNFSNLKPKINVDKKQFQKIEKNIKKIREYIKKIELKKCDEKIIKTEKGNFLIKEYVEIELQNGKKIKFFCENRKFYNFETGEKIEPNSDSNSPNFFPIKIENEKLQIFLEKKIQFKNILFFENEETIWQKAKKFLAKIKK